jgi:hypothetical protein
VLERYTRVLPLTVLKHQERVGYARSLEELLRQAVDHTDRPKRDAAVLMHADFAHGPAFIPDLVRRIESGADIVIAQGKLVGEPSRTRRAVRRLAPMLLRGVVSLPGVSDVVSGFAIFRLITLRNAFRNGPAPLLVTHGWAVNAELYIRAARYARRIETITAVERRDLRQRPSRTNSWEATIALWRSREALRQLPNGIASGQSRATQEGNRQAEVAS